MARFETKLDIHQHVTDKIVAALETCDGKWTRPWVGGDMIAMPRNIRGTTYRGVNVFILWVTAIAEGYKSPVWGTYKQWEEMGTDMSPLKGQHGTRVVLWKPYEIKDKATGQVKIGKNGKPETTMYMKSYTVFNANQFGLHLGEPEAKKINDVVDNAEVETYINNLKAKIDYTHSHAFYRPTTDEIGMPTKESFIAVGESTATENFYSTLFHEITHWTGADKRCNRKLASKFDREPYAMEELIAEMGAAFFCARFGISPVVREDHAQYIKGWLSQMKADKKAIFTAASLAQHAVDFCDKLQGKEVAEETGDSE